MKNYYPKIVGTLHSTIDYCELMRLQANIYAEKQQAKELARKQRNDAMHAKVKTKVNQRYYRGGRK